MTYRVCVNNNGTDIIFFKFIIFISNNGTDSNNFTFFLFLG